MSIHPSLTLADKDKKARSVLKRIERLRSMIEKNQWKKGDDVCGLPKIKTVRIKIKKEKKEKTVAATAEGVTPTAASETKEQPPAKGTAAKSQEKK